MKPSATPEAEKWDATTGGSDADVLHTKAAAAARSNKNRTMPKR